MIGPSFGQIPKRNKVAGVRAVSRAIAEGSAKKILVAKDAETKIITEVLLLAEEKGIEVVWVARMKELGEYCGISVGASCCAVLESINSCVEGH